MGRQLLRVPPNWQHPKTTRYDCRLGRDVECYKPLLSDYEAALADFEADVEKQGLEAALEDHGGGRATPPKTPTQYPHGNFDTRRPAPPVDLDRLVRQLRDVNSSLMAEMRRQYPVGSRVIFWRSANQRRESFGTVVSHTTAHGPEIRVRYDGSNHVVGLHVGYTKFHSLPNDQVEARRDKTPPRQ